MAEKMDSAIINPIGYDMYFSNRAFITALQFSFSGLHIKAFPEPEGAV
jgi:hypothetical protein